MVLTVGLFQLENLMLSSARFHLLDLRLQPMALGSARVQACLNTAHVVQATFLNEHLKNFKIGSNDPILLVCEDGRLSYGKAEELQRKGFNQVYVVEGGTDGLLREADDSSGNTM